MTSRGVWGRAKLGDYVQIVNLRKHFSQGRVARRPVSCDPCNMYDRRARRLNKTIHSLATENIILKMQNEGIKTSLMRQKSRRKQGKALELPLPQPNHGGAEFWSPRKIQQGLD